LLVGDGDILVLVESIGHVWVIKNNNNT